LKLGSAIDPFGAVFKEDYASIFGQHFRAYIEIATKRCRPINP